MDRYAQKGSISSEDIKEISGGKDVCGNSCCEPASGGSSAPGLPGTPSYDVPSREYESAYMGSENTSSWDCQADGGTGGHFPVPRPADGCNGPMTIQAILPIIKHSAAEHDCCNRHDMCYQRGGTSKNKNKCDKDLADCFADLEKGGGFLGGLCARLQDAYRRIVAKNATTIATLPAQALFDGPFNYHDDTVACDITYQSEIQSRLVLYDPADLELINNCCDPENPGCTIKYMGVPIANYGCTDLEDDADDDDENSCF